MIIRGSCGAFKSQDTEKVEFNRIYSENENDRLINYVTRFINLQILPVFFKLQYFFYKLLKDSKFYRVFKNCIKFIRLEILTSLTKMTSHQFRTKLFIEHRKFLFNSLKLLKTFIFLNKFPNISNPNYSSSDIQLVIIFVQTKTTCIQFFKTFENFHLTTLFSKDLKSELF